MYPQKRIPDTFGKGPLDEAVCSRKSEIVLLLGEYSLDFTEGYEGDIRLKFAELMCRVGGRKLPLLHPWS